MGIKNCQITSEKSQILVWNCSPLTRHSQMNLPKAQLKPCLSPIKNIFNTPSIKKNLKYLTGPCTIKASTYHFNFISQNALPATYPLQMT